MAKKASAKTSTSGAKPKKGSAKKPSGRAGGSSAGDAFVGLLQSPLVAELVAVAATAALATLAEEGFAGRGSGGKGKRAGKAVKQAGKAAAAAVGRRLSIEIDEIKKAAKSAKAGAKA
jgi:hypothetical protein